mgnify:CR=1 FL=1
MLNLTLLLYYKVRMSKGGFLWQANGYKNGEKNG